MVFLPFLFYQAVKWSLTMSLIATTSDLEKALARLAQAPFVTVDTEFHRQSTYYPELCLIQLASPAGQILIDPLSPQLDLKPFFALMQQRNIVKVFHAARQDIEIIFTLSGHIPEPLFDTQIAAQAVGYGESAAYDSLVYKITGVRLDKSSRFTDWSRRPLTQKQLDYALADVTYLRDIYLNLNKNLEEWGRQTWIKEEMAVLAAVETYKLPPEQAWKKIKGQQRKLHTPRQWAALQSLAAWREEQARRQNLPRGHILADDSLIEIAAHLPQDKQTLLSLRSLRKPPRHRLDINALLQLVIEAGKNSAHQGLPQFAAYSSAPENNKSEVEILKLLLKLIAEEHNLAQKLIAGGDDISRLAAEKEKADIAAMHGWRFELFGSKALAVLSGRLALKFDAGRLLLFEPAAGNGK